MSADPLLSAFIPSERAAETELDAMGKCIAALDPLASGHGNYGVAARVPNPSIGRIVRYLIDRYSIENEVRR